MNGNGLLETYDEALEAIESYDESDDESYDETAEFLPIPGLSNIASGIGGGLLGNILGGGGQRRSPLPRVRVPTAGQGVSSATINTPRGNATLRLPEPLVTRQEFQQTTQRLEEVINRNTTRLNSVETDARNLTQRVTTVVTDTNRRLDKLRADQVKAHRQHRLAHAKLVREQNSRQTTNLLMSLMLQRRLQARVDEHTHTITGTSATGGTDNHTHATGTASTGAPAGGGSDNSMMMMLPMMMMGSGSSDGSSGSGDNSMMMMAMMMAFM